MKNCEDCKKLTGGFCYKHLPQKLYSSWNQFEKEFGIMEKSAKKNNLTEKQSIKLIDKIRDTLPMKKPNVKTEEKKMKIPIGKLKQGTPKKMTNEMIEKGMFMLDEGNSERFVARKLGVSRHTIRIHCRREYKQLFRERYKSYNYLKTQPNQMAKRKESARERYKILNELYPKEMKEYRKIQKQRYSKEYFMIKSREFRERHPDYYKKYYINNL